MRCRISAAALFVNVTARMPCGETPSTCDQPFDAVREHARLAAARAGEHERGQERRGDRLALRIVERREDVGDVHGKAADSTGPAGPWRTVRPL